MTTVVGILVWRTALYSYGLFNYFMYFCLAVKAGTFFVKPTEQDKNEFLLGEFAKFFQVPGHTMADRP